jgi:uncharacterized membrane protein YidH (DUF202 family)
VLLAEIAAPAALVAWSPVKIVSALVLVLNSPRPKSTSLALLIGWLSGLAAVTALFMGLPELFDPVRHSSVVRRTWASIAIAGGVLLFVVAGYRWRKGDRAERTPNRLVRFAEITPSGAGILGVILPVAGPKVLAMCATAGVAIGNAKVGALGAGLALVCYIALAASPVIVAVVGYWLAAETVNRWLVRIRQRLEKHQDMVATLVIVLIGLVLVVTGLRAM